MTPSTTSSYHLSSSPDGRCSLPAPPSTRRRPMPSPQASAAPRRMFPSRFVVHNQPDAQTELMSSTSEGSSSHDTVKPDQLPSSCVTQSPLDVVFNDQEGSMSTSPDQHHVYVPIGQHDATSSSP